MVAGKAHDTGAVLASITAHQTMHVVPPKSNRKVQRDRNENHYENRNEIERCLAASSRRGT